MLGLSELAPRVLQSEIRAMSVACDAVGGVNLAQGGVRHGGSGGGDGGGAAGDARGAQHLHAAGRDSAVAACDRGEGGRRAQGCGWMRRARCW